VSIEKREDCEEPNACGGKKIGRKTHNLWEEREQELEYCSRGFEKQRGGRNEPFNLTTARFWEIEKV